MIKKWQTLIQAHVDVRTTDGYLLRFFVIGFTKKSLNQLKKTCYAKRTQVKKIRRIMRAYIIRKVRQSDLKSVVNELIPDAFAHTIEKKCAKVYPLHDVMVRKVKVLKKPKIDMARLLELHDETRTQAVDSTPGAPAAEGVKIDRPDGYEVSFEDLRMTHFFDNFFCVLVNLLISFSFPNQLFSNQSSHPFPKQPPVLTNV